MTDIYSKHLIAILGLKYFKIYYLKKFSPDSTHCISKMKMKLFPSKNITENSICIYLHERYWWIIQSKYITTRSLTKTQCVSNKEKYAITDTQRNNVESYKVLQTGKILLWCSSQTSCLKLYAHIFS